MTEVRKCMVYLAMVRFFNKFGNIHNFFSLKKVVVKDAHSFKFTVNIIQNAQVSHLHERVKCIHFRMHVF